MFNYLNVSGPTTIPHWPDQTDKSQFIIKYLITEYTQAQVSSKIMDGMIFDIILLCRVNFLAVSPNNDQPVCRVE